MTQGTVSERTVPFMLHRIRRKDPVEPSVGRCDGVHAGKKEGAAEYAKLFVSEYNK